jgi:hypothetical protein
VFGLGRPRRIGWKVRVLLWVVLGYLLYRMHLLGAVIVFAMLDQVGTGLRVVLKKLEREYGGNFAGFQ